MTIKERAELLYAAQNDLQGEEKDPRTGKVVKFSFRERITAACRVKEKAAGCKLFLNTFCWILDPEARKGGDKELPFLLRPFQEDYVEELVEAIERGEDLLTEKSRLMGATWVVLGVIFWYWIFEDRFSALLGSINIKKVDLKGDQSTLFGKLDYMVSMLRVTAPWLLPEGYTGTQPYRTFAKMENPANGAIITGEAPTPDFGRSGRYKVIFPDELAAWPFGGFAAWTSMSFSAQCRLPVSTPKGLTNQFGRLANPKRGQEGIRKVSLHWSIDPTKNYVETVNGVEVQPWYEEQRKRFSYDPSMLAQEVDIDYSRSVQGQIYPGIAIARRGIYDYDPDLPLFTSWDFGVRDYCAIIWIQYDPIRNRHRIIDSYRWRGKPILWYVPFITGESLSLGAPFGGYTEDQMQIIERHSGFWYHEHYGDPAGKSRNHVTATSVIQELARHGIYIRSNDKMRTHEQRIDRTRMLLPLLEIDERHNDEFIDDVLNYRWSEEKPGTEATARPNKPVHDEASHFATALEFYAVNQKAENLRRVAAVQTGYIDEMTVPVFGSEERYLRARAEAEEKERLRQDEEARRRGYRRGPVRHTGTRRVRQ